jgi:hypothetical protein
VGAAAVVRIVGLNQFRASLKKAGVDMADMKRANQAAAETVAKAGAERAPRISGTLAGSLRPRKQVARARVESLLIYAPVIHWGWPARNIEPQKFLTEAADATQPEWLAQYEQELQRIVDGIHGA